MPLVCASQRRAVIAIERGAGERGFNEAFTVWGEQRPRAEVSVKLRIILVPPATPH